MSLHTPRKFKIYNITVLWFVILYIQIFNIIFSSLKKKSFALIVISHHGRNINSNFHVGDFYCRTTTCRLMSEQLLWGLIVLSSCAKSSSIFILSHELYLPFIFLIVMYIIIIILFTSRFKFNTILWSRNIQLILH